MTADSPVDAAFALQQNLMEAICHTRSQNTTQAHPGPPSSLTPPSLDRRIEVGVTILKDSESWVYEHQSMNSCVHFRRTEPAISAL
jgi:hypothetical protein